MTKKESKQKVELEDIIGLVRSEEPTDSVELKKESSKGNSKERYTYGVDEYAGELVELRDNGKCIAYFLNDDETCSQIKTVCELLNKYENAIKRKSNEIAVLEEVNRLCLEVIGGVKAYIQLKEMGMIEDE